MERMSRAAACPRRRDRSLIRMSRRGFFFAIAVLALTFGAADRHGPPAAIGPPPVTGSVLPLLSSPLSSEPSLTWGLIKVDGGGRILHVHVAFGGCAAPAGWNAAWTAKAATMTVYGTAPVPDQVCTAELGVGTSTITLPSPLGTRTLDHAPTSAGYRYLPDIVLPGSPAPD